MNLRHILSLLLIFSSVVASGQSFIDLLPSTPEVIADYDFNTAKHSMSERPLHHIEGIWRFTDTGITVAIRGYAPKKFPTSDKIAGYRLIVLQSPNRTLKNGTVIGYIMSTAKPGVYEANIYTQQNGLKLTKSKKFTLTLNDTESSIVFSKHRSNITINIWRALPYLLRGLVRKNEPEKVPHGCVRIFPEPDKPLEPIYL